MAPDRESGVREVSQSHDPILSAKAQISGKGGKEKDMQKAHARARSRSQSGVVPGEGEGERGGYHKMQQEG
ncbi:hypothetical protein NDU88_003557 [Pleurodeles waltl]|uniref:Uncharacterized protein n=1 Tax=Pleurodeles waltl TaxID=8319 RepID=A0AAV7WT34_PLEWA|nr:hypothetical protein NDU88_003557 [Pleurodeles waltl]